MKNEYMVYNFADGIPAAPETYTNKKDAIRFAANFKKRFARQGYYSSAKYGRIPLSEIRYYVRVINMKDLDKALDMAARRKWWKETAKGREIFGD